MIFQKDIETMSRQEIEEIQLRKLKHQVQYCMDNVPFYHKRLTEAGVLCAQEGCGDLVLVACARAVDRMNARGVFGCKTLFDVAPADLSPMDPEEMRKKLL